MNLPLPTDERILGASYKAFTEGMAGRDLFSFLDDLERGALIAIEECSDYREAEALVIRYQQRKGVAQALRAHITNLIDSLGGDNPDGSDTDNPESDDTSYSGGGPAE